jgi:hypothetical protein
MIFNANQIEFKNEYAKSIWHYALHIVPLEISLAGITDEKIREGCTQMYNCTMEILEDMYTNSDEYKPLSPRAFLNDYFLWIIRGGVLIKYRDRFERALKLIPRFGFAYDENYRNLTNPRYPLFAEYLDELGNLAKTKKQNLGGYLERRDFRLFNKRVALTDDDLLRPLSDIYKGYYKELHDYALSKGAKLERRDCYTFRYTYNKLHILILNNYFLQIEVPYRLNNAYNIEGQFERFLEIAENQTDNDSLITYLKRNLCICNGCRGRAEGRKKIEERCGKWVRIRDKKRFISMCHPAVSKYNNIHNAEDIQMLKRMMDIRIEQIKES